MSFAADGFTRTLYLATPLQVLENILKAKIRLLSARTGCGDIVGVLGERGAYCIVHQL